MNPLPKSWTTMLRSLSASCLPTFAVSLALLAGCGDNSVSTLPRHRAVPARVQRRSSPPRQLQPPLNAQPVQILQVGQLEEIEAADDATLRIAAPEEDAQSERLPAAEEDIGPITQDQVWNAEPELPTSGPYSTTLPERTERITPPELEETQLPSADPQPPAAAPSEAPEAPSVPPSVYATVPEEEPASSSKEEPSLPIVRLPIDETPAATDPPEHAVLVPAVDPQSQASAGRDALRPVLQRANEMNDRANQLAQRGAVYLARDEALAALRLIAQAKDLQEGVSDHSSSLTAALVALREADDFASPANSRDDMRPVAELVVPHRTKILKDQTDSPLSPVEALQRYLTYAQRKLVEAGGGEPVASRTLYMLGKLQINLPTTGLSQQQTQSAKALVYQQAALGVSSGNYLAANELGVLLARFGQLPDARRVLLHSVTTKPHADGWHNLAVVHDRLGETALANRARKESARLSVSTVSLQPASKPNVQWVDAATFAAGSRPQSTPLQKR